MEERNQIELINNSRIYELVFKQILEGIIILDPSGKVNHFNDSALKIFRIQSHQLMGMDSLDDSWRIYNLDGSLMKRSDYPAILSLKTGRSIENTTLGIQLQNKDLIWLLVNARPILDSVTRQVLMVIVTFHDISEKINQQNEMFQTVKLATLNEFSSGFLHDLNNPISIIKGHVQQLIRMIGAQGASDNLILEKLRALNKATVQLTRMMAIFRNYARDGRLDEPELVNIHDLLEEVVEVSKYKIRKNNASISIEVAESFNFYCRPTILMQIIVNLVMNANDALQNQIDRVIHLKARLENSTITISVLDHCIGIESDKVHSIFQPFCSSPKDNQGLGLGLSNSKKLIESQGGSLTFSSNEERTIFELRLPIDSMIAQK